MEVIDSRQLVKFTFGDCPRGIVGRKVADEPRVSSDLRCDSELTPREDEETWVAIPLSVIDHLFS